MYNKGLFMRTYHTPLESFVDQSVIIKSYDKDKKELIFQSQDGCRYLIVVHECNQDGAMSAENLV